jgi:hypothetical protein
MVYLPLKCLKNAPFVVKESTNWSIQSEKDDDYKGLTQQSQAHKGKFLVQSNLFVPDHLITT